jgi:hypothetical protein
MVGLHNNLVHGITTSVVWVKPDQPSPKLDWPFRELGNYKSIGFTKLEELVFESHQRLYPKKGKKN